MLIAGTLKAKLAAPLTAAAGSVVLDSIPAAFCAALTGGNSTLVELIDGINTEIVTATACSGNTLTITRGGYGTTARAFIAGSCTNGLINEWLCALFAQGGCTPAATAAVCAAASIMYGKTPSDPEVGVLYQHAIVLAGDAPFNVSALVKPSWMTVAPLGSTTSNTIMLTGTPTDDTEPLLQLGISNCAGANKLELYAKLCYCEAAATL